MDEALQDFIAYGLVFVWIGVDLFLLIRSRLKQIEYLRRFPPVDGVWLDTFTSGNPFGRVAQAIRQVSREPQVDPELEQLRLKMVRRGRLLPLWLFGFPVIVVGVTALLIVAGVVHLH